MAFIPDNDALFAKFGAHPILRFHDADVVHVSAARPKGWVLRRFVYAFELAPRLSQADVVRSRYGRIQFGTINARSRSLSSWHGWDAFTSMKALSTKIAQLCSYVRFTGGHCPTLPF